MIWSWLGATVYVLACIGLAEGMRVWRGWGSEYTRKIVHIGVGMLVWAIPFLFETARPFILTAIAFSVVTLIDNRFHFFPAMASKDNASNLGTFYFPIVAALVAWLFWDRPAMLVAAMMPLVWGDGMAEVIGRKFGRIHYQVSTHQRSAEGSLAFFLFTFIASLCALTFMPYPTPITFTAALLAAFLLSLLTTLVEALSPSGSDNVTVTLAAIIFLTLWPL